MSEEGALGLLWYVCQLRSKVMSRRLAIHVPASANAQIGVVLMIAAPQQSLANGDVTALEGCSGAGHVKQPRAQRPLRDGLKEFRSMFLKVLDPLS